MNQRRTLLSLSILLLACGALLIATVSSQNSNPASEHRGPPWRSPVASTQTFRIAGSVVQVDFAPGALDLPTPQIMQWVENAASSVATYYGRFPVPRDRVLIMPTEDRRGVMQGTSWGDVGGSPAFTRIRLGQHTTADALTDDWMMTHELVHGAFPSQEDEHHWIEEGIAVYVEPVARVQTGFLQSEKIWSDMVRDMPKGLPAPDSHGLDQTRSWANTYWGGAVFCLLADVQYRERTHNQRGLQHALRGILQAGGSIQEDWPITRAFDVADHAVGVPVLSELYARMKDTAVPTDLPDLWRRLGVSAEGRHVTFHNDAELAAVRQAITAKPA